jgi:hypothetical protein
MERNKEGLQRLAEEKGAAEKRDKAGETDRISK